MMVFVVIARQLSASRVQSYTAIYIERESLIRKYNNGKYMLHISCYDSRLPVEVAAQYLRQHYNTSLTVALY